MSTEAKVGAFTVAGLALLVSAVLLLSGVSLGGSKGYALYVGFRQVVGIEPQSVVRLSGVPVGAVREVANDGGGVTVTMDIKGDVKIPRGSRVTIGSAGVMGEKFINILPAGAENGWVADGDYLIGEDEKGMDTLMDGIDKTLGQVQELLGSVNDILGNKDLQHSLVQSMVNIQAATKSLDRTMAVLENLAVSNQGQMTSILTQLNSATAGMDRTMQSVEAMMKNLETVGADPQTAENLRQTLNNVADASARVVRIAQGLENVIADEKTQEDLKATIHNARQLTERADGMLKKVSSIEVKPEMDVLYSGGAHDWKTDFNIDVGKKDGAYFKLGVDDIGNENNINAQLGSKFANSRLGVRGGVVNGKPGLGLDIYSGKRFQMSVEGYDPDDMQLRLDASYDITGNGTALAAQWDHVNDSSRRRAYFGIRQSF